MICLPLRQTKKGVNLQKPACAVVPVGKMLLCTWLAFLLLISPLFPEVDDDIKIFRKSSERNRHHTFLPITLPPNRPLDHRGFDRNGDCVSILRDIID